MGQDADDFERYIKNIYKRQKQKDDQHTLDQILIEMKQKNEQQYQEKISKAKKDLELLIKQGN